MANLAIIPARGGSKRIPRKNIKDFLGKPIIAYSIEVAKSSGLFDEIMVSTDDTEIADLAIKAGAHVPVMRSFDTSNDFIDDAIMDNSNILIHCQAGRSRSVTILAAYIIKTFGIDVDITLDIIKNKRSIIEPNKYFVTQLEKYYNELFNA